ncbi:MAG: 50S ribosomal protein L10, partial [bacterium]
MALNREAKAVVIDEVSAQVAQAQSIILAEYRGLDVANITDLRKKARNAGVYLRVLKNTLVRRS